MMNDVLTASGLFLQTFLGMMSWTWGSIYWRTLIAFRRLDY
jgi:hypothetical protein